MKRKIPSFNLTLSDLEHIDHIEFLRFIRSLPTSGPSRLEVPYMVDGKAVKKPRDFGPEVNAAYARQDEIDIDQLNWSCGTVPEWPRF